MVHNRLGIKGTAVRQGKFCLEILECIGMVALSTLLASMNNVNELMPR